MAFCYGGRAGGYGVSFGGVDCRGGVFGRFWRMSEGVSGCRGSGHGTDGGRDRDCSSGGGAVGTVSYGWSAGGNGVGFCGVDCGGCVFGCRIVWWVSVDGSCVSGLCIGWFGVCRLGVCWVSMGRFGKGRFGMRRFSL